MKKNNSKEEKKVFFLGLTTEKEGDIETLKEGCQCRYDTPNFYAVYSIEGRGYLKVSPTEGEAFDSLKFYAEGPLEECPYIEWAPADGPEEAAIAVDTDSDCLEVGDMGDYEGFISRSLRWVYYYDWQDSSGSCQLLEDLVKNDTPRPPDREVWGEEVGPFFRLVRISPVMDDWGKEAYLQPSWLEVGLTAEEAVAAKEAAEKRLDEGEILLIELED